MNDPINSSLPSNISETISTKSEFQILSSLLDSLELFIVILNSKGQVIYLNRYIENVTGFSSQKQRAKYIWDLPFVSEASDYLKSIYTFINPNHFPIHHQYNWENRRGEIINIKWSDKLITNQSGDPEFIICTGVKSSLPPTIEQKLFELENRTQYFYENIEEVLYFQGIDGAVQMYNKAITDITGYSLDEFANDPMLWSRIAQPDNARIVDEFLSAHPDGIPVIDMEYRLRRKDGVWRWVQIHKIRARDKNNTFIGYYCIGRDITDRKMDQEQLSQQLREIQTLLQTSQMLASSMELSSTLQQIVDSAASLLIRADQAVIHLIDETETQLKAVAVARVLQKIEPGNSIDFKPGEGIAGLVIATSQTINISDVNADSRFLSSDQHDQRIRSLLVAPIRTDQKIIGTLSVHSSRVSAFTERDERLLTTLGTQAALAIRKAQLLEKEQEQRQMAEALRDAGLSLGTTLEFEAILDLLLDQIIRVVPYDSASIWLIEGETTRVARLRGYERLNDDVIQKITSLSFMISEIPCLQEMISTGKPVVIPDTASDPKWRTLIIDTDSWAGAPILAQGEPMAFFSLDKYDPNYYQSKHAERLGAFAGQAALSLQNARLFETTQRRLKEVNTLYQISQEITKSLNNDAIIHNVLRTLQKIFNYYFVQVYLVDEATGELIAQGGSDLQNLINRPQKHRVTPGKGIVGRVAITGNPYYTNDVTLDSSFIRVPYYPKTGAQMAVPIRSGNHLTGVLDIHVEFPHKFSDSDLQLMIAVADLLGSGLEKVTLYSVLQGALHQEQAMRMQLVQSEKLAALGRIIASVAHELNNPLQAIQNALYLVQMEELPNEQTREDIQVALHETTRMADLIGRLRETYRPRSSEEFRDGSINNIIIEVQKLISTHLRHNNISFTFSPSPSLPECKIIEDQIKQVFLNICLNAVESMPEGGNLTITTYQKEGDLKGVNIDIKDTGPGIKPDILPYIFDPFITTKDGGTGLGLAITYDIIQRHSGKIDVASESGKGTIFKLWLPIDAIDTSKSEVDGNSIITE
jgi:PAS domain S-box-containing protein